MRWSHQHEEPPELMHLPPTGGPGVIFGGALFLALLVAAILGACGVNIWG